MVPVFSWLVLGGKCRNCKSEISVQYPIIEGVNGILYVVIFAVNGLVWSSAIYCLMTSALLVLSVIDWRTYEIPFGINVFLFVLGIAMTVLGQGESGGASDWDGLCQRCAGDSLSGERWRSDRRG